MNSKIKNMIKLELTILLGVLIIFIVIKTNIVYLIPRCIINETFHILCPSCGGTRCVMNFISGNWYTSFLYHPIFFITIIYLIIVNILYIINSISKKEILTFLYPKTKFWIIFIIIIFIFTIIRNIII